jgi:rhodanese-related sulfurtransferase/type 1 glutamine amidotransferase
MKPRMLCLLALGCSVALSAAEPARKPTVVLISGEFEYKSAESLPAFKKFLEAKYPVNCVYLERKGGTNVHDIPGLEVLEQADLAVIFIRRMTLPQDQLNRFKQYLKAGKPIVGIRTASHAFENWKEWDREVLGGNYHMHYGQELLPVVRAVPEAAHHPILKGLPAEFTATGGLYKNAPLPKDSSPLLLGSIPNQPVEPVAWTHSYQGSRIFYTSLGHPKDFETEPFKQLVVNAIYWGLNQPVPAAARSAAPAAVNKRIGVDEFEKLWRDKKNVVLDVRTAEEFADGHLPGAINIDVNDSGFAKKAAALDKSKTYLVHCAAGVRSAKACGKLAPLGFTSLYDLAPGFKGWEQAGKPTVK